MGKRSNNGLTYFQCDWTSFPMAKATCQFPSWRLGEDGKEKFSKVGSYLNFECVIAKAEQMCRDGELTLEELDRVREYVQERTGCDMQLTAEALEELDPKMLFHFGGTYSMGLFRERCEAMTRERRVTAILIPDDKSQPIREVTVETREPELLESIEDQIGGLKGNPDDNLRISQIEGRARHNRERKLEMFHAKNNSAAVKNPRATQLLRGADVFGNAVIVQYTTEHDRLLPRMVSYTLAEYDHVFSRKKKASAPAGEDAEPVAVTSEEFKKMKVQMSQASACAEQKISSKAVPPQQLARSKPLPQKSGQQLAAEYPPPSSYDGPLEATPPPIVRQKATTAA